MNTLAKPLHSSQIEAAQALHCRLPQWQETDLALHELGRRFPEFDGPATLLKVTAINALYGTRILAVNRMARHVQEVMADSGDGPADWELVERLAMLPADDGRHARQCLSFASKFAHFFIAPERFPIKDRFAEEGLRLHLGSQQRKPDKQHPYCVYLADFERLKKLSEFTGTNRELDRYLWLAGQYLRWQQDHKEKLGREVIALFTDPKAAAELDALLPP